MAKPARPPMSLGLGSVNKGTPPAPSPDEKINVDPHPELIMEDGPGLTLHLKRLSYEELKRIALAERTTVHALLVEGVQKLFESRNSHAVALAGNRPGSPKRVTKEPR